MALVSFDLSPDVLTALKRSPDEFAREMRIAAAIYWYRRGEVSQSKAAEIAGMQRVAFMDELARRGEAAFSVDMTDLKEELGRD